MRKLFIALALGCIHTSLHAQIHADDVWVRATVSRQQATGGYLRLHAQCNGRLLAATSPVAGLVEIHEMRLEDGVMRMNPVDGLDLRAGTTVELKPGGYHLMLLELKQPLRAGDVVPLSIVVKCDDEEQQTHELKAAVRPLKTMPRHAPSMNHDRH